MCCTAWSREAKGELVKQPVARVEKGFHEASPPWTGCITPSQTSWGSCLLFLTLPGVEMKMKLNICSGLIAREPQPDEGTIGLGRSLCLSPSGPQGKTLQAEEKPVENR